MSAFHATLTNETLLAVVGPDAATFLQGQLTCDVTEVSAITTRLGAYCNPQGRMVCDFLLSSVDTEHFNLRLRADNADHAAATLGKYIVFSKADIIPAAPEGQIIGIWGENSAETIAQALGGVPSEPLGCWRRDGVTVVRLPGDTLAFECYLQGAESDQLAALLAETTQAATTADWEGLQHVEGLGRVEAANAEEFIPQMLNYDLTGHVSFTKGCYTGQEVVARMHYRGKSKRRLYRALLAGGKAVPGDSVYASSSAQSVGNVAGAASMADRRQSLLVVATADGALAGLHLGAVDGPELALQPLPYPLEPDTTP